MIVIVSCPLIEFISTLNYLQYIKREKNFLYVTTTLYILATSGGKSSVWFPTTLNYCLALSILLFIPSVVLLVSNIIFFIPNIPFQLDLDTNFCFCFRLLVSFIISLRIFVSVYLCVRVIIVLFQLVMFTYLASFKRAVRTHRAAPGEPTLFQNCCFCFPLLPLHQEASLVTKTILERGSFHQFWELRVEEDGRYRAS